MLTRHCKLLPLECVKARVKIKPLHTPDGWIQTTSTALDKDEPLECTIFLISCSTARTCLKGYRGGLTSLVCFCRAQGLSYKNRTTPASRKNPANFKIHYTVSVFSVQRQWNIPSRLRLLLPCNTITLLFCIENQHIQSVSVNLSLRASLSDVSSWTDAVKFREKTPPSFLCKNWKSVVVLRMEMLCCIYKIHLKRNYKSPCLW